MNHTVLIAGTIIIILFSWSFSIRSGRYHGIPRFFAFESIFLLCLLNWRAWFHNPFSIHQIISWICLIISAYAGLAGVILLKMQGKPEKQFENTTHLVTTGIYHYIRHPLYLSLLLFGLGVMLKEPGLIQCILGSAILISVYFTAAIEEKEMLIRFKGDYKEYMGKTRMFIPCIL